MEKGELCAELKTIKLSYSPVLLVASTARHMGMHLSIYKSKTPELEQRKITTITFAIMVLKIISHY